MRALIIVLLSILYSTAKAGQEYYVQDGDLVHASITKNGLSRISLQEDRIKSIKGLSGDYALDKDDLRGDIYIKPQPSIKENTISLYLTSEKGKTYQLELVIDAKSEQTVQIINIDKQERSGGKKLGLNKSYDDEQVISLIKAAYNKERIKGYAVKEIEKPNKKKIEKGFLMFIDKQYSGKNYQMDVLRVENNSKFGKTLSEQNFMVGENVVAVAADTLYLPSKSYTNVYVVYKR